MYIIEFALLTPCACIILRLLSGIWSNIAVQQSFAPETAGQHRASSADIQASTGFHVPSKGGIQIPFAKYQYINIKKIFLKNIKIPFALQAD